MDKTKELNFPLGNDYEHKDALSLEDNLELAESLELNEEK